MPKIYHNIENHLTKGLNETLKLSLRTDFCVGYFNLRGWKQVADRIDSLEGTIVVDSLTFSLEAVGEKSGFKVLLCQPQAYGLIPDYSTRKKIETKVTKLLQEHLIIFFDTKKTEQVWQLV